MSRPSFSTTLAALALAAACSLGSAACSAEADDDGVDQVDDALIGGKAGALSRFPATVYLKGTCTAAKVAPKRILTAAHCVLDPATLDLKYKAGAKLSLMRDPSKGYADSVVAAVHVHPTWLKACADTFCAASAITARLDAPDVAVIDLVDDLADVPVAAVSPQALAVGDRVTVVGFGCTVGVLTPDNRDIASLKYSVTRTVADDRSVHVGSPVLVTDLPQVSGIYSMTAGPGSAKAKAGLCPGDSGGPLYVERNGITTVVGVNSNYTLAEDTKDTVGLPITNWHTRLDDASKHQVGQWLRSLDVPTPTPPAPPQRTNVQRAFAVTSR